ncbi:predicted protein [Plenodomus lingam JN3]|uniref:Predicted protein n=1 Tax=Leptosphaeria maculans (strain JN3 / isolate v23.1.3 / race Av1-4-5-6-7-8) TaxID=985895 RepID=E5A9C2_LEPMJ|nr:predicted protein [Plenodomus lingam JN3]CBY00263.1 predicted protein [Plenodomus lingam JN3]
MPLSALARGYRVRGPRVAGFGWCRGGSMLGGWDLDCFVQYYHYHFLLLLLLLHLLHHPSQSTLPISLPPLP